MRKLHTISIAATVVVASFGSMAAPGLARPRTLIVLMSSARKEVQHGLAWSVLGAHHQRLGTGTDTISNESTMWKFRIVLSMGTPLNHLVCHRRS